MFKLWIYHCRNLNLKDMESAKQIGFSPIKYSFCEQMRFISLQTFRKYATLASAFIFS